MSRALKSIASDLSKEADRENEDVDYVAGGQEFVSSFMIDFTSKHRMSFAPIKPCVLC